MRAMTVLAALFLLIAQGAGAKELTLEKLLYMDNEPIVLTYKTVGEKKLNVHIYKPADYKAGEKRPVLFMIHGGGWASPGPFHMAHMCRYFALRGMIGVNVEYRLVSKETTIRIRDCIVDCRDALRFIRKEAPKLGIDPARIVVGGESAGGHLAACLALSVDPDNPGKTEEGVAPSAALLYDPSLNLPKIPWMKGHAGVAAKPDSPKDETWEDRAKRVSPNEYVRKGLPPIMLMHGTKDGCVPVSQADEFHNKVRRAKNKIKYHRIKDWGHAFLIPNYGKEEQIEKSMDLTDRYLASLGYVKGKPILKARWQPPAYKPLFSHKERKKPYVKARSFTFEDFPYLDGQWQGIITDSDDNTWFSISSHSGIHHAQVFRYSARKDRVDHVADLGQVCGEKLPEHSDGVPEGKIHSNMFEDGEFIFCATTDAHRLHDEVYTGGYWLKIHRKTGRIENLGRTITKDGLLCAGYDHNNKLMYGHTNVKGLLTCFNPATRKEEIIGFPWEGWDGKWPRGLVLMFSKEGKVYGSRPPNCSFWEYDPATKKFRTFGVDMPLPEELKEKNEKKQKQYERMGIHNAFWDEQDKCFYMTRSFDEYLMRLYLPEKGKKARVELLHRMRPSGLEMRYGNRPGSCALVMHDRTVYYAPGTGWGGVTHLVSYHVDKKMWKHHGPIVVEGYRRACEIHSISVGKDGKLYMVAFVYSIKGIEPVRPYSMRDKYPFHPRFVIVDPKTMFRKGQ